MISLESGPISVLHECCSSMAPALILDPTSDVAWHAHFESISLESVTLRLLEMISCSFETSNLFVSFSHRGNCCTFFAKVLEYQSNSPKSFSSLSLELPHQIIIMERRMSYRVPIGKKTVPSVRLLIGESQIFHPKPKDLSLTGISVEFHETEDPDLPLQTELWLELRLDDHEALLKSTIKRRKGHRYSLFFPEVLTDQGIHAPQSLRIIVESLEHAMILEKSGLDKPDNILSA